MSFSWKNYYEKNGKWEKLESKTKDMSILLKHLSNENSSLYKKVIDANGKEILKEHFYHTVKLANNCIIPGTFDMEKHLKEMNFPDDFTNKNCLDVGCADGFISCQIAKNGGKVTALDAWPLMLTHVEFLSKIFDVSDKIKTISADFHEHMFDEKIKFDVIVMMHVMCHHPHEGKVSLLDKIDLLLDDDGIFLSCDNDANVQKLLKERYDIKELGKTKLQGCNTSILFECKKRLNK